MKIKYFTPLIAGFALAVLLTQHVATGAETPVPLGAATDFAVLAGTSIVNTGNTVVRDNLGVSPGVIVTGFGPGVVNGTISAGDVVADAAQVALATAYDDAAGRMPVVAIPTELGGTTQTPGVYDSVDGMFAITGNLTLDGQGNANAVFIFQSTFSLITATSSQVTLIGGAQAKNIFWQVGSSATLGTSSTFNGNILALISITLNPGAAVNGRMLARNGVVTLNNNIVTAPPPTVMDIGGGPGVANIAGGDLTYTFTFSEAVTGFTAADINVVGGTKVTFMPISPSVYALVVTPTEGFEGSLIVDVPAAVASDLADNPNTASELSVQTIDTHKPTVTINQAAGQVDPANAGPINFTVVFSEPVADFATGDVTLLGTAVGPLTATVTGSETTYNVAVTGMTSNGTVIATVMTGMATDTAGNSNAASTSIDNTVTLIVNPSTYTLTVVNGTGSGVYAEGTFVPVIATIPAGKIFDIWAGDIGALADAMSASTLATMPEVGITITALFNDAPPATYTLTVTNGTGGGSYTAGTFVPVIATIPAGKVFYIWAGDIGALADANSASTIATMPAAGITITALFEDAPPATYTLTVVNGTGSGAYAEGTFVPVIATLPLGKIFDTWAGDVGALADSAFASTIATMPATAITITAVFKNAPPTTYTLTVVNGTGGGAYAEGTFVPVVATIPVGKVFDTWAGDIGALDDPESASTLATMPAVGITISALFKNAPPTTYTLTVVNGTGGGAYPAGTLVPVTATVPGGKFFVKWVGDIGYLADSTVASTTVTSMPAHNITIAGVFTIEPPWFPRFNWTPVPYYDWYDLQVWNGVPGTAGSNIVLETYVMRGMMTPEREYLLGASYGLLPGTYYWRYRTWVPETDTFGTTWLPTANGRILTVDYRNPPINTTNAPVAPNGLGCTPNPGPAGNFNVTFTALNAQGYDLEITGNRAQNNQILHDTYFMPGADYVIPFNELTTRPITLVGPDTCTWRVRGFNPFGDSAWSSGPAITVTAVSTGTVMAIPGIPDYTYMRPTDGGVVTAPSGTAAIAFEWNPVPGATGYVIFIASASGVPILNYVDVGNVTWVDSFNGARIALPPGSYVWCLTAYNADEPRQYGGWNHSPRSPAQESPIFFDVVETLTAPTFLSASKGTTANTASVTWVGGSLADPLKTVDVMLFYTTAGGWLESNKRPVTVTGTQDSTSPLGGIVWTGTIPLGLTWGPSPNYLLLTGKTAAGVAGPRSRLFLLP